jgi:alkylation response protein AidB-like acyl-CoA dehydrogenase
MRRRIYESQHEDFRAIVRRFLELEVLPDYEKWERAGIIPREVFLAAGEKGLLGMAIPEEYGGGGSDDFRFNAVIGEEAMRAGVTGFAIAVTLHNDICAPYYLSYATEEQKGRWLPGIAGGELICAIAMTEPGIGSDLASMSTNARREGDRYVVNGAKTFITNGINADLVITAVKTDRSQRHSGMSLLVLERGMAGFERGRNLEKLGQHAQDTAELFFTDVHVPVANLLGQEGQGFKHLVQKLPQERLSIAVGAVAAANASLQWTVDYVKERKAFGKPVATFQNTRFKLAEIATEARLAEVFVDECVRSLNAGELTAEDAAMAKWWTTELQGRAADVGVQLHGGYGYMLEYPIARAYADARVARIYGGTTEIMKEIIGRSLGL